MDWIWKCVKGFIIWTGLLAAIAVFCLGGMLAYDIYYAPVAQEIGPIKLQVTGPSASSM
ncbi:MAG: hypothetical protein V3S69_03910 [Dehalococcoidales bacterium]